MTRGSYAGWAGACAKAAPGCTACGQGTADIDHCFPFAAWPCNDLWNLLPSAPAVNRSKGDRLPAAEALERSRSWILEWWDLAYRRDIVLRNQFEDEARSALPAAVFGLEDRALSNET